MAEGILWQLAGGGFDPAGSYASGLQDYRKQQTILQRLAGQKEDRQFRRETDARDFGRLTNRDAVGDQHWSQTYNAGRSDHASSEARANALLALQKAQFERGEVPTGYERDPNDPTRLRPRVGGPNDPATIRQTIEAQRVPVAPKFEQIEGPDGRKIPGKVMPDASFVPQVIPGVTDAPPLNPFAANGKMTQDEKTSGIYADRMTEANKLIGGLENVNSGWGGFLEGVASNTGRYPNAIQSEGRQKYEQAKRDFVNAVLRRESGAVINPSEFANAEKQYFPQPGDAETVIAQKRKNRETALHGFYRASGPHYKVPQPSQAGGKDNDPLGIR